MISDDTVLADLGVGVPVVKQPSSEGRAKRKRSAKSSSCSATPGFGPVFDAEVTRQLLVSQARVHEKQLSELGRKAELAEEKALRGDQNYLKVNRRLGEVARVRDDLRAKLLASEASSIKSRELELQASDREKAAQKSLLEEQRLRLRAENSVLMSRTERKRYRSLLATNRGDELHKSVDVSLMRPVGPGCQ